MDAASDVKEMKKKIVLYTVVLREGCHIVGVSVIDVIWTANILAEENQAYLILRRLHFRRRSS